MIDQVHDWCMEHGIKIIANAADCQWSKLTTRSTDDEPLTRLQYQKDVWNLYHKENKTTLLQKLNSYSTASDNMLKDVSMASLDIGGNFLSGNIDISVKSNTEGSRCIHVSSVGYEDHQIPMIKNITSTKVPATWKRNVKPKRTVLDECKDIIDVLSLIPPEYLQDEVEYDDENDLDSGGVDNDTMEVDNEEEGKWIFSFSTTHGNLYTWKCYTSNCCIYACYTSEYYA